MDVSASEHPAFSGFSGRWNDPLEVARSVAGADGSQRRRRHGIEGGDIACGYVFIDKFCYSVDYNRKGDFWLLIRVDPEMGATFHGTVATLRRVTKDLLAGKEVKVPVDESVKPVSLEERRKRAPALNEIMTKNRQK